MDTRAVQGHQGGDKARKRAGRRPRGIQAVERAGYWHAHGTLRAGGRSHRIRASLNLAIETTSQDAADQAAADLADEIRNRATGKLGRGYAVSIAARAYLSEPRARPLRPSTIVIVKEVVARFGERRLNEILADEWREWIDGSPDGKRRGRMTGRKASTRERFIGGVLALLKFAQLSHGMGALPVFRRDNKARNPNHRARRRTEDLRPDLIQLLFDSAHIAIRTQLAVECATGARVSSILHGARLCDLILAKGREQIIFRGTKSGEDVPAALTPSAIAVLRDYLKWRGALHDREAPLFLTPRRKPYVDNGRAWGSPNKSGFNAAKRRAQAARLAQGEAKARALRKAGRSKAAAAARHQAAADAALLGKVTQHWFRHRLAKEWLRKDPRAAMGQGGWLDIRSLMGYADDVPAHRRQLAAALDPFAKPFRKAGRA